MNIVFLTKMYAEALGVADRDSINDYSTAGELLQTLRNADLIEIASYSRAFVKVLNLSHPEPYSAILPECLRKVAWAENIEPYMGQITAKIGRVDFKQPLNGLTVSSTMDCTIFVWPSDKTNKYTFADCFAKEVGLSQGQEAMLSVPNWCI